MEFNDDEMNELSYELSLNFHKKSFCLRGQSHWRRFHRLHPAVDEGAHLLYPAALQRSVLPFRRYHRQRPDKQSHPGHPRCWKRTVPGNPPLDYAIPMEDAESDCFRRGGITDNILFFSVQTWHFLRSDRFKKHQGFDRQGTRTRDKPRRRYLLLRLQCILVQVSGKQLTICNSFDFPT